MNRLRFGIIVSMRLVNSFELHTPVMIEQDFNAFTEYIHQFTRDRYMDALSDFHLLIYLATCDMLPLKVSVASSFGIF
jgi:NPL4 family